MENSKLKIGGRYTREEIHGLVGGGELVIYLPAKGGRVLAGCFDPELNKRAPIEVDVGRADKVVERAHLLGKARSTIPVFLKRDVNDWEHVGHYRCLRFSEEPTDLTAYPDRRKDAVGVLYFKEVQSESSVSPDAELFDVRGKEGRRVLVLHFAKERQRGLILAKRNESRALNGCLVCEACGVRDHDFPQGIGEACFEVHHRTPLGELTEETETTLADLSVVCANCHRMLHRSNPMLSVEALGRLVGSSRRAGKQPR